MLRKRVDIDLSHRVAEKAASRAEDARALASGEKSVTDLRRENGAFAFPPGQVRLNLSRGKLY